MTREMHALPGGEIGKDLDLELSSLFLKRADLARQVHATLLVEFFEIGDLVFQLRQRLLELDDDVHAEIALSLRKRRTRPRQLFISGRRTTMSICPCSSKNSAD